MDTVEERVALPGGEIELTRPREPEALLGEEAFEHEQLLPYWAELWQSSVALAHDVAPRSLRGARTLELGCGLGLPALAAARAGGRVVASDWSELALAAAAGNAARNGVSIETVLCDWAAPEPLVERAPWEIVVAADVLYERRTAELMLELLPRLVDARGRILIADPGRPPAEAFVAGARRDFELVTTASRRCPQVAIHRLRPRHSRNGRLSSAHRRAAGKR